MKNKTKIYVLTLFLVFGIMSCSDPDITESKPPSTNHSLGKTSGNCNCASFYTQSGCFDDCIVKSFMQNKNEIYYDITWENCDNNEINGTNCRGTQAVQGPTGLPLKTRVKFCYMNIHDDMHGGCTILMEIDNLPSCLKCLSSKSFPRCIKFRANCSSSTVSNPDGTQTTTTVLNLTSDDPDVTDDSEVTNTTITIQADPKIKICCERPDPLNRSFTNWFCCTGDLQPAP